MVKSKASTRDRPLARAARFCGGFGLRAPILLAPMAGACPPALSTGVMQAGGMGACGALLMEPDEIAGWCAEVRSSAGGPFQLNLWVPDPLPLRDPVREAAMRAFLRDWGPEPSADAGDGRAPDFKKQCEALLDARPAVISSIMGLYPPGLVAAMKAQGIAWFATATTLREARAAAAAGADAIIAQGAEAGGHRGAFDAAVAERRLVGLFSLLPAIAEAVEVPVIAAGGIADGRSIAAALCLGASAVSIGTAFLRTPEAGIAPAWRKALADAAPEDSVLTRAFSGRLGRSLETAYVRAADGPGAPVPAPYPVQRGLTAPLRAEAARKDDLGGLQAWSGQSAARGDVLPAGELVPQLWEDAQGLLVSSGALEGDSP